MRIAVHLDGRVLDWDQGARTLSLAGEATTPAQVVADDESGQLVWDSADWRAWLREWNTGAATGATSSKRSRPWVWMLVALLFLSPVLARAYIYPVILGQPPFAVMQAMLLNLGPWIALALAGVARRKGMRRALAVVVSLWLGATALSVALAFLFASPGFETSYGVEEAPVPGEWTVVHTMSGVGYGGPSQPFTTSSEKLRVTYKVERFGKDALPFFAADLISGPPYYEDGTINRSAGFPLAGSSAAGSGTEDLARPPGNYHLHVKANGCDWELVVEQYTPE